MSWTWDKGRNDEFLACNKMLCWPETDLIVWSYNFSHKWNISYQSQPTYKVIQWIKSSKFCWLLGGFPLVTTFLLFPHLSHTLSSLIILVYHFLYLNTKWVQFNMLGFTYILTIFYRLGLLNFLNHGRWKFALTNTRDQI